MLAVLQTCTFNSIITIPPQRWTAHPPRHTHLWHLLSSNCLFVTAHSASQSYYKSFPLMDFSQYQTPAFQPVPGQHKEKSYMHQPAEHDLRAPLSISIPSSHLEHPCIPKTTTHPMLSSSAFKAWEPTVRHVHRQVSAPGHTSLSSSSVHSSTRRHGYSYRRQQSKEKQPDIFNQPYGGMYGDAGGGSVQVHHPSQSSYYQPMRQKSISTHSATEVTVWGSRPKKEDVKTKCRAAGFLQVGRSRFRCNLIIKVQPVTWVQRLS